VANINSVTIVGNVTRDPELRYTSSGLAVCNFSVASNRRWMNKSTNDWEEKVSFFDVTVWADHGQNVAESVLKGDRVVVTGRMEQRSWETETGDKRTKVEIVADVVAVSLEWATVTEIVKNEKAQGAETGPNNYRAGEENF
jgi:single-strand DNA-binding protein